MNNSEFYRSAHNQFLGGVCQGIADKYQWDVSVVRLITVLLVAFGGVSAFLYILLWIILPVNNAIGTTSDATEPMNMDTTRKRNAMIGGAALIFLGVLFLLDEFLPEFDFSRFWPVLVIAMGIATLVYASRNKNQ